MDTYQPRFDMSFWNLDALELSPKHKAEGIVERKIVKNKINEVSRLTILKLNKEGDNQVIWLRPSARAVEMLDLKSMRITPLLQWEVQNTFIDVSMDQGFLYALARFDEKYYIRRYRVVSNGLMPDRNWPLASDHVLPGSHLKVATCGGVVKAFISTPGKNEFAIVDLTTKQTARLDVQLPADDGALGPEIDFCIDTRNETLVIADTWHHRIVEVNYNDGEAHVICGNGQAGNAPEQTTARGAQLNSPSSVAIYRPNEMIQDYHLSVQSQNFLLSDADRTLGKTVVA